MKEDYFAIIDTKQKAYWLGFLLADGRARGRTITLHLSVKDKGVIDLFASHLEIKISEKNKRFYGPYKTSGKSVYFYFKSERIAQDLKKYGMIDNKTLTIRFPKFNSHELNLACLLGYFDGDGSFSGNGGTLSSGSKEFLQDIKDIFSLSGKISLRENPYGSCFELHIPFKFFLKMIDNYENSLKRKRQVKKCTSCSQPILIKSTLCRKCNNKKLAFLQRKITWPTVSYLENRLKTTSYLALGRELGVSDNAIRKYIKNNRGL